MIRRATLDDMPDIVRFGAEFLSVGPYAWVPIDDVAFPAAAARMIEHGAIFLAEDGMIGGVIYQFWFNPAVTMAAELFWYSPKKGRALRDAFEDWGRSMGCAAITCSGLANEREPTVRKLFGRAGYDVTEVAFVKRFAA
jgi:hypothetical protein